MHNFQGYGVSQIIVPEQAAFVSGLYQATVTLGISNNSCFYPHVTPYAIVFAWSTSNREVPLNIVWKLYLGGTVGFIGNSYAC